MALLHIFCYMVIQEFFSKNLKNIVLREQNDEINCAHVKFPFRLRKRVCAWCRFVSTMFIYLFIFL